MKKTSRKILVPLIVLALGIALVSAVGAAENFGQKPGQGFKPEQNPGHDANSKQWNKGHDFNPGFQGYWNYLYRPYNWYHQFKPYYNPYNKWYWYYQPWNHQRYDQKKH